MIVAVRIDAGRNITYCRCVFFKFHEGIWQSCKENINLSKKDFSIQTIYKLSIPFVMALAIVLGVRSKEYRNN